MPEFRLLVWGTGKKVVLTEVPELDDDGKQKIDENGREIKTIVLARIGNGVRKERHGVRDEETGEWVTAPVEYALPPETYVQTRTGYAEQPAKTKATQTEFFAIIDKITEDEKQEYNGMVILTPVEYRELLKKTQKNESVEKRAKEAEKRANAAEKAAEKAEKKAEKAEEKLDKMKAKAK